MESKIKELKLLRSLRLSIYNDGYVLKKSNAHYLLHCTSLCDHDDISLVELESLLDKYEGSSARVINNLIMDKIKEL